MKRKLISFILILCVAAAVSYCGLGQNTVTTDAYYEINNNIPSFTESEITEVAFEKYSELDALGRCGVAVACIGTEIMPEGERESIGQVKPSGWQISKYDFVDGKYLYNRCHLIGYQLTGENANEKNLITGTRYMNTEGMLPFENMVAEYVKETGNHVMYRVTPEFEGANLVAKGVHMEAYSVEDMGKGVSFNVFCNNIQPGVVIDYSNGNNFAEKAKTEDVNSDKTYILNTNSKKYHNTDCASVKDIKSQNKETYHGTKAQLEQRGYKPCNACSQ